MSEENHPKPLVDDLESGESHSILRAIYNNTRDGILVANVETQRFVAANDELCRMIGYSADEIRQLSVQDIHPKPDLPYVIEQFEGQSRGEFALAENIPVLRKDGTVFFVEISSSPVELQGKLHLIGVFRDITERKQLTEELTASEQRLQKILDNADAVIYIKDREGRYLLTNRRQAELTKCAHDDIIGRTDHEIYPKEIADAFRANDLEVLERNQPMQWQERAPHDDGLHDYLSVKFPLHNSKGEAYGICGVSSDITEQLRRDRSYQQQLAQAAAEWHHAMDFFDDAIYLLDLDRRILRANQAFCRMAGQKQQQVIGRHIAAVLHPDSDASACPICHAHRELKDTAFIMEPEHPDNPLALPIEVVLRIVRDDSGEPSGMLMTIRDLSRSRETDAKLRQSAAVYESTQEGVMITDLNGSIVAVNPAFTEITGYPEQDVLGKTPKVLSSGRHEQAFYEAMWASILQTGGWRGEIWNRRKDGGVFPEWLTISTVRDSNGEPSSYVGVFTDITQLKLAEERLHHLAHHDPLTELPNRLLFRARLEHAMQRAKRDGTLAAVLFLDLDRFKHVNDSLGHTFGDQLLQAIANRLMKLVRGSDTVARMGGDEFTVLLEGLTEAQDAALMAIRLTRLLASPLQLQGREIYPSVSVGIAVYPHDGQSVEALLKNADAAMYFAKEEGRNTYRYYSKEMTDQAFQRVVLEGQLRKAITDKQLILHYQPRLNMQTRKVVGLEALVRWQHPERGLVPPANFIPIAEETGQIVPLGNYVLELACAQAVEWLSAGLDFGRISVNVAGLQVERGDLVQVVEHVLESAGLAPNRLELELTESCLMQQTESVLRQLDQLRRLGVWLALDDFGKGYSALSYLKRMPFHTLKIDRSFVSGLPNDTDDSAIARAIIAMAQSMRYNVVAEGIETQEQHQTLLQYGCREGQGFHYYRPLPVDRIEALLKSNR